jgi:hypothetical protein
MIQNKAREGAIKYYWDLFILNLIGMFTSRGLVTK